MTRLSLLIVDMSEDWEEVLKAQERGYFIEWRYLEGGGYERGRLDPEGLLAIRYPHGSVRAGFNAVIDTARLAGRYGLPVYAVEYERPDSDGEERTCPSLQPHVPEANRYPKRDLSAFDCGLAERLEADGCRRLLVMGYDRDDCVLATVRDAVARGLAVVTSEHCMLTTDRDGRREASLAYFRERTSHLESLIDVWNLIVASDDD